MQQLSADEHSGLSSAVKVEISSTSAVVAVSGLTGSELHERLKAERSVH